MVSTMVRRAALAATVVLASAIATPTASLPAPSGSVEVLISGLDNPRGLNFGPLGRLYVAEAGTVAEGRVDRARKAPAAMARRGVALDTVERTC